MSDPLVTVLMSAQNSEQYIGEAIQSVLDQTFRDFEFIIIDDGSTDNTLKIIRQFDDPRIRVIKNPENWGIPKSLNGGLSVCRGKYIARMDSDDVCFPNRLETQVNYLESHPDIGVLGSEVKVIGQDGQIHNRTRNILTDPYLIKFWLLFDTVINNPTTLIKKEFLDRVGGYNPAFKYAEDYELWTRLVKITKIAVSPESLVYWRDHGDNATFTSYAFRRELHHKLSIQEVKKLTGVEFSDEVFEAYRSKDVLSPRLARQVVKLFRLSLKGYVKTEPGTAAQRKELINRVNWVIFRVLQRTKPQVMVADEYLAVYLQNRDIFVSNLHKIKGNQKK